MIKQFSREERLVIIEASYEAGVLISDVAKRYGLRPKDLYNWRSKLKLTSASKSSVSKSPALKPNALATSMSESLRSATKPDLKTSDIRFVELINEEGNSVKSTNSTKLSNTVISYKDFSLNLSCLIEIRTLSEILQVMRQSC